MLAVAPDGNVTLRSLHDQPYDSGEQLVQAMQSFPMLVFAGGVPAPIKRMVGALAARPWRSIGPDRCC